MAGLRERQKHRRRKNMLDAALKLFRERGYDHVKLEEVAEEADVSVGTVYTYFKTKNALLLAVIVDDFDRAFVMSSKVLENPIKDGDSAVADLSRCYFYDIDGDVSREMWRVAVAAFFRDPDSEFGRQYEKCLSKMQRQYVALIRRLQTENLLSDQIIPTEFASILYNNANMCFLEYLRDDKASMDVLMARLNRHNKRLLHWAH